LRLEGILVNPSTVRNIWLNEGLETSYKRILGIKGERGNIEPAEELIRLMGKANPWFRERTVRVDAKSVTTY